MAAHAGQPGNERHAQTRGPVMKISDLAVRRPVFATVISLLIIAFGAVSFTLLPLRELPDIDRPIVGIDTSYRGAAAAVIENRITQVIEDQLAGIEGVDTITSSSRDGRSSINIEFSPTRNVDDAANDVRDRVAGVADELPQEADPPEISKQDADADPIMFVALQGQGMTMLEVTDYADRFVVDRITSVNGVATARVFGAARISMRIWLDRQRLTAFGLTSTDVEDALRRQNVELPAGRVQSDSMNLTVRVNRPYETAQEFNQLVLRRGADGYLVRLGDVARVQVGPLNPYTNFRVDGVQAVGIGVVRQSTANTIEVARAVRAAVEDINRTLPKNMRISVSFDSSVFIQEAINKVYQTLAEAAILVILVIFIFLGSVRATLMPAVAVPISLVGTFIALAIAGASLNLLTLLALVLAIGLVVDDAIVVLENVYHRIEQGESPLVAAYKGTAQVGFAVVASTAVVVAVFIPVMFLPGFQGMLFRELAIAMVGALLISLLVSLTLTPAMCSKILKQNRKPNRLNIWVDRSFTRLSDGYGRMLERAIARPLFTGIAMLVTLASIVLFGRQLGSELAPQEDSGIFFVNARMAEGTGYDYAMAAMTKVQDALSPLRTEADGPVFRLVIRVPGGFGAGEEFNSGGSTVILKPWSERDISTEDVVQEAQKRLSQIPEVRANASQRSSLGGGRGQRVQFVISGSTFEELAQARDAILAAAEDNPGLVGIDADYRETKPQLLIDIDVTRAADLGVSVQAIGRTLETMMGSRRVTTFLDRGEERDVVMQAQRVDRLTLQDVANTYVRSERTGELVPLNNLITMRESADAGSLGRFNRLRSITISSNLAPGYSLGDALTFLEEVARQQPQVAAIGYRGESRDFLQTGGSIYWILLLAIVVIFLVLAAQFESFVHPMTIILTVPMAIAGAVLGLWLLDGTLNIYSQIGILILIGLATKNGILIVEFANQLRDEGRSVVESVVQASQRRLRPILMTSIATVAGALPLMLATGAGAASRETIGTVIVFGVSVATVLTLFVIPVVYGMLARFTQSPEAVSRRLDAELDGGAERQPAE
jgi:multidrug efflux pump